VCVAVVATLAACSALPPASPIPAELDAQVELFGSEVARLRALPQLREVPAGIQSEDELRASMQSLMREEWGEPEQALERAYKQFGLIPREIDLLEYLIDLYTGQIAGYYDPKQGRFFIKERRDPALVALEGETDDDATSGTELQFVISHEFVHALQDQHFDLVALDERFTDESDRSTAISGLIEGDAMLGAIDHLAWRVGLPVSAVSPLGRLATAIVGRSASQSVGAIPADDASEAEAAQVRQLSEAPPVIATNLTFPYVEGMAFASALRSEFGQAALDEAFRDPPESTEQILYPERYFDRRDHPANIELPAPPEGFRASPSQTLGMLDLSVLLDTFVGNARAARGWDGDRFALWAPDAPGGANATPGRSSPEALLVWVSSWDSVREARRFERVYAQALRAKRGDTEFEIRRESDVVRVVEGGTAASRAAAMQTLDASRIERDPSERPRPGLLERALTWPLRLERLDRVRSAQVLGGNALALRAHVSGYRFTLGRGAVLRSELTPDRSAHSIALGLVWCSSDRLHEYFAAVIPGLMSFQKRGSEADSRMELHLGQTLLLPSLLRWRREEQLTRISLAGLIRLKLGPSVPRGERVSLFLGRIPLPF